MILQKNDSITFQTDGVFRDYYLLYFSYRNFFQKFKSTSTFVRRFSPKLKSTSLFIQRDFSEIQFLEIIDFLNLYTEEVFRIQYVFTFRAEVLLRSYLVRKSRCTEILLELKYILLHIQKDSSQTNFAYFSNIL